MLSACSDATSQFDKVTKLEALLCWFDCFDFMLFVGFTEVRPDGGFCDFRVCSESFALDFTLCIPLLVAAADLRELKVPEDPCDEEDFLRPDERLFLD